MCQNTDFSGQADLEPLELLESDDESLRSYEVYTLNRHVCHRHLHCIYMPVKTFRQPKAGGETHLKRISMH